VGDPGGGALSGVHHLRAAAAADGVVSPSSSASASTASLAEPSWIATMQLQQVGGKIRGGGGSGPAVLRGVDNDNANDDDNSVVVDGGKTNRSAQGSPYPTTDTLHAGILSNKPFSFFLPDDPGRTSTARGRCERYGFTYLIRTTPRRIVYGALIADEAWEVFEIVGAEAHGIFSGVSSSSRAIVRRPSSPGRRSG
jgi:hypothetical protein